MDDDKTIKIQKLKGASNYRIWSAEIRAHLEGKGLLNVALGNEPRPARSNPRSRAPNRSPRTRQSRRQANADALVPDPSLEPTSPADDEYRGSDETPLKRWKRKDARARSLIMTHYQTNMKDKVVHLEIAKEI
jgi:hypothetical protein